MGSVRAGYDPDFALSPDGSRLYIASGERESGELAVINTSTGKLRHIPFADRVLYKPWFQGLPPFSGMAVTSAGLALWILGQHVFSPDSAKVYLGYGGIAPDGMSAATELRVFDTTTWKQLGRVQTSVPFWSAVASHDGKYV